jgi:hypothetical protein
VYPPPPHPLQVRSLATTRISPALGSHSFRPLPAPATPSVLASPPRGTPLQGLPSEGAASAAEPPSGSSTSGGAGGGGAGASVAPARLLCCTVFLNDGWEAAAGGAYQVTVRGR